LRITAGKNKGKKLSASKSNSIRPTLARVRKSFFDILGGDLTGIKVIDLYAGAGTLGIESISRGASFVLFVDSSKEAVRIIKKNLILSGFQEFGKTKLADLPQGLDAIPGQFSLVFLDPPYEQGLAELTMTKLSEKPILTQGALIFAQVGRREELLDQYGKMVLKMVRKYGDTKLYLYENK